MEDNLRTIRNPIFISLLVVLSSCGMLRRDTGDRKGSVSREQYEQLQARYDELSERYEKLKTTGVPSTLADELQAGPVRATETVDIFAPDAPASASNVEVPADVEAQLSLFRRGMGLRNSNPGEATKIFQQLENQGIPPVRARAKLQIGQILFDKQQHDLALQVFEDIIQRNANSGVVIDALRLAMASSEKLGLKEKRDQYSSMLNDVFGAN
jgi:tetratricopeptide (TPR) repeat protein